MKPDLQQKRIGAAAARLRGLKHWETLGVEGKATCAEAALVAADEAVPVIPLAEYEVLIYVLADAYRPYSKAILCDDDLEERMEEALCRAVINHGVDEYVLRRVFFSRDDAEAVENAKKFLATREATDVE